MDQIEGKVKKQEKLLLRNTLIEHEVLKQFIFVPSDSSKTSLYKVQYRLGKCEQETRTISISPKSQTVQFTTLNATKMFSSQSRPISLSVKQPHTIHVLHTSSKFIQLICCAEYDYHMHLNTKHAHYSLVLPGTTNLSSSGGNALGQGPHSIFISKFPLKDHFHRPSYCSLICTIQTNSTLFTTHDLSQVQKGFQAK